MTGILLAPVGTETPSPKPPKLKFQVRRLRPPPVWSHQGTSSAGRVGCWQAYLGLRFSENLALSVVLTLLVDSSLN